MSVTKQEFRTALGHFASAVTVVTTKCADDRLAGITVTAFCPFARVAAGADLHRQASVPARPLAAGRLLCGQYPRPKPGRLSCRFCENHPDQFNGVGYTSGIDGTPLLDDVLAVIECRIAALHDGGDHTMFVGQVEATRVTDGKPLMYYRGGYGQMG